MIIIKQRMNRRSEGENSLVQEEIEVAHNLYCSTLLGAESFQNRGLRGNSIWMGDTKIRSVLSYLPESKAIHQKITGGFLISQILDLAHTCACILSGGNHRIVSIDDILFKEVVELGSILFLNSSIVYSNGNEFQVRVEAEKRFPSDLRAEGTLTTIMIIHFKSDEAVAKIVPNTYGETLLYLSARRHFQAVSHSNSESSI